MYPRQQKGFVTYKVNDYDFKQIMMMIRDVSLVINRMVLLEALKRNVAIEKQTGLCLTWLHNTLESGVVCLMCNTCGAHGT